MTTTGVPTSGPTRARLDRSVLVSNVISGALWLVPLAFASWPLSLIGAAYVVAGSVFLAAAYAREFRTITAALVWVIPWLVAVSLWTLIVAGAEVEKSVADWLVMALVGLCVGTLTYLAWQIVALAVRHQLLGRIEV